MSERVYHMDDCVVALPPGFNDRSIHVLEWKTTGGDPIVVAIQREPLGGQSFVDRVDRETKEYPSKFVGWKAERDETVELSFGVPCRRVAFRWKRDRDVVYNHQAFVRGDGKVIVFTGSGKARDRDEVDRLIDGLLETLRFRED